MHNNARFRNGISSSVARRFTRSTLGSPLLQSSIRTHVSHHRHSPVRLKATAFLVSVIVNAGLAMAQQTTSQSTTLQYEFTPQMPYSTDGLSFASPTVSLFIGVSDYGEPAKVTSTPAHALGAAVMYEAFVDAASRSEKKALDIPAKNYFKGGEGAICTLVFSPDGSYFVSGSKDGTVKIGSGTRLGQVTSGNSHKSDACAAAFSPDSSQLVTGGSEGDAVVQSVKENKVMTTLKHPAAVCSVAFSQSGSKILSTSMDGITRIWEPTRAQEPLTLSPEQDCSPETREVKSCADATVAAFGPDDKTAVTTSCRALRVWNLDKPGESKLLGNEETNVRTVSFSPDGSRLLSVADDGLSLWEVAGAGRQQAARNPNGRNASFSPDGTRIAVADATGMVSVYKIPSMQLAAALGGFGTPVKSLQFSHNGQYILVNAKIGGAWMQDASRATIPTIVPRPDQAGKADFTIKFAIDEGVIPDGRKTFATVVSAFSPDADYVVAGYEDGSVGIHPGIGSSAKMASRLENQALLGDLKFDRTATSIMEIWYLEQLHGASRQLIYHDPNGSSKDRDDPNFLQMGRGEPVTRKRIFDALSSSIEKAEHTAGEQETAMLVVYIAAHGWIGWDGRQYLLSSDADASNPSTWIAYEDFLKPIRDFLASPTHAGGRDYDPHKGAIVIFDTCQILLGSSRKTPAVSSEESPINLTVIESTSPGQYAWHWTGNLNSTESTTSVKSTSRFGLTHHSGPKQVKTKSEYYARMSMFPYASQWALNALIKDKEPNAVPDERKISLKEWVNRTQKAVRALQSDIPEGEETGQVQEVRLRTPPPGPDSWIIVEEQPLWIFEVDSNAPVE